PPRATLLPYTTLFRSRGAREEGGDDRQEQRRAQGDLRLGQCADEAHRVHVLQEGVGALGERVQLRRGLLVGAGLVETGVEDHRTDRKSTRLNSSHVKI